MRQRVRRRIEFLLQEAASEAPAYDLAIKFTLRAISNYLTVGKDAGSAEVKLCNPRMSAAAYELRGLVPVREWTRRTINDHAEPLGQVWKWMVAHQATLTIEDVTARLTSSMVTITIDEDEALRDTGFASAGAPAERYARAGIMVLEVPPLRKQRGRRPILELPTKGRSPSDDAAPEV